MEVAHSKQAHISNLCKVISRQIEKKKVMNTLPRPPESMHKGDKQ